MSTILKESKEKINGGMEKFPLKFGKIFNFTKEKDFTENQNDSEYSNSQTKDLESGFKNLFTTTKETLEIDFNSHFKEIKVQTNKNIDQNVLKQNLMEDASVEKNLKEEGISQGNEKEDLFETENFLLMTNEMISPNEDGNSFDSVSWHSSFSFKNGIVRSASFSDTQKHKNRRNFLSADSIYKENPGNFNIQPINMIQKLKKTKQSSELTSQSLFKANIPEVFLSENLNNAITNYAFPEIQKPSFQSFPNKSSQNFGMKSIIFKSRDFLMHKYRTNPISVNDNLFYKHQMKQDARISENFNEHLVNLSQKLPKEEVVKEGWLLKKARTVYGGFNVNFLIKETLGCPFKNRINLLSKPISFINQRWSKL